MNIIMGDESFVNTVLTQAAEFICTTLETANETVQLAQREVRALEEAQEIRLDEVRDERQVLKAERDQKKIDAGTHHWEDDKLVRTTKD